MTLLSKLVNSSPLKFTCSAPVSVKKTSLILAFYLILISLWACQSKTEKNATNMNQNTNLKDSNLLQEEPQDNKIVIYQLMMRLFGNKNTTNKKKRLFKKAFFCFISV